jgi:hypothetical protein
MFLMSFKNVVTLAAEEDRKKTKFLKKLKWFVEFFLLVIFV